MKQKQKFFQQFPLVIGHWRGLFHCPLISGILQRDNSWVFADTPQIWRVFVQMVRAVIVAPFSRTACCYILRCLLPPTDSSVGKGDQKEHGQDSVLVSPASVASLSIRHFQKSKCDLVKGFFAGKMFPQVVVYVSLPGLSMHSPLCISVHFLCISHPSTHFPHIFSNFAGKIICGRFSKV